MTDSQFMERFGATLNPSQAEAVRAADGAVLLLAVPGSGKTTVLVTRLGYLVLCRGIAPRSILTMTYTVAATREMGSRFERMFGEEYSSAMEFRTINGLSQKIIDYAGRLNGRPPFQLQDNEGELNHLVRELYRRLNRDYPTDSIVKDIRTAITYIKNMMLTAEEIREMDIGVGHFPELYAAYCKTLRDRKQMDFDDQMQYALTILQRVPAVLEHFQEQYRYLCVDESQDTSRIQHEIIRLLAKKYGNLFMVGDEDQSIYGFRAAYPEALVEFEQLYPEGRVLVMEENYRSTAQIIAAANDFVSRNRFRHPKQIRCTCGSGDEVQVVHVQDRMSQYHYLFELAKHCNQETAVLFRNNDSAVPLIDMLERKGIRYNCRRFDEVFFSHRVVVDISDIIGFAYEPTDTERFARIYYKLGCPIRKEEAQKAVEASRKSGKPILHELLRSSELKQYTRNSVQDLVDSLKELPKDNGTACLKRIRYEMGYGDYLERCGLDAGKITILEMVGRHVSSPKALLERLDELKTLIAEHENSPENKLVLSTVHSSKGLEYERVYLLDVLDGILPMTAAETVKTDKDIRLYEEERRLFYVAVTRAKGELNLFSCQNEQSQFVDELLKILPGERFDENDYLTFLKRRACGRRYESAEWGEGTIIAQREEEYLVRYDSGKKELLTMAELLTGRKKKYTAAPPQKTEERRVTKKKKQPAAPDKIAPGAAVEHSRFGKGTVLSMDIEKIAVRFDDGKERTFLKSAVIPSGKLRLQG